MFRFANIFSPVGSLLRLRHVSTIERDWSTGAFADAARGPGGDRARSDTSSHSSAPEYVAAARALHRLADRLLATASVAIGEFENAAVAVQPR